MSSRPPAALLAALVSIVAAGCADSAEELDSNVQENQLPSIVQGQPIGLFPQSSGVQGGQYGYSIPIVVPPGRAGMEPRLALAYGSGSSPGSTGYVGWNVAGLSQITRCPRNLVRDGIADGINYDVKDNFCLDGMKLVPLLIGQIPLPTDLVVNAGLVPFKIYAPENESGNVRVISFKSGGALSAWVAISPGKVYRWYGETDQARVSAQRWSTHAVESVGWLLSGEVQRGNRVDYTYVEDETNCSTAHPEHCDPATSTGVYQAGRYIDTITYTRWVGSPSGLYGGASTQRKVKFNWQSTDFPWAQRDGWLNGIRLRYTARLKSVEVFGPNDDKARTYKLTGTVSGRTKRDLLATVTMCDRNDICLPPTKFEYSTRDTTAVVDYSHAWEYPTEHGAPGALVAADLTEDGNDDLMYLAYGPPVYPAPGLQNYLAESPGHLGGDTFSSARSIPLDDYRADPEDLSNIRIMTLDHDLVNDFIYVSPTEGPDGWGAPFTIHTREWDHSAADDPLATKGPPTTVDDDEVEVLPLPVDFDGDGMQELVLFRRAGEVEGRYVINIYDWSEDDGWVEGFRDWTPWDPSFETGYPGGFAFDVNGDNRDDLVVYQVGLPDDVYLTLTDDWTLAVRPLDAGSPLGLDNVYPADINGDGLPDAVRIAPPLCGECTTEHTIRLNTGDGFGPEYAGSAELAVTNSFDVRVTDFNADGRDDFLILDRGGALDVPPTAALWVSNGTSLINLPLGTAPLLHVKDMLGPRPEFPQWQNTGIYGTVHPIDANGDGVPELVTVSKGIDNDEEDMVIRMLAQDESVQDLHADLLVHVENGLTVEEWIDYASLGRVGDPCTNAAPTYPLVACVRGGVVVTSHRREQPIYAPRVVEYSYHGARADTGGRGFLGFERIEAWDPATRTRSVAYFDQYPISVPVGGWAYPRARAPFLSSTTVEDEAGAPLFMRVDGTTLDVSAANGRYRITLRESTWSETLGDETRRGKTVYTGYDAYGHARFSTTTVDGGGTYVTDTSYQNDPSEGLYGLPTSVKRTWSYPGTPNVVAQESFAYLANGLVSEHVIEPGSSNAAIYQRDDYTYYAGGLLKRAQSRDKLGTLVRGFDRAWTPDGHFVAEAKTDLGDVNSYLYYPTFGLVAKTIDQNGRATTTTCDTFGEIRKVQRPQGDFVEYSRTWNAVAKVVHTTTSGSDGSWSETAHDIWMRPVGRQMPTFDGVQSTSVAYDSLGRVIVASAPHGASGPFGIAKYEYDALGSLVAVSGPGDLGRSSRSYDGFDVSTVVDPAGRRTRRTTDAAGRVTKIEHLSACPVSPCGVSTVVREERIEYDAVGRVVRTWEPGSAGETLRTYDLRGRLATLVEPNTGTHVYKYNALGELATHSRSGVSGGNVLTKYTRDAVGRVVDTVSQMDGTTRRNHVTFSTTPGFRGLQTKLERDNDGDGAYDVTDSWGYDLQGRLERHDKLIGGLSFTVLWGYDANNKLEAIHYPKINGVAKRIRYEYNATGMLAAVSDQDTGQKLWEVVSGDVTGVQIRKGDDIVDTITIDPMTGQLRERVAEIGGVPAYHRTYAYSPDGRLEQTTDELANIHETFEYDEQARLSRWTHVHDALTREQAFAYDATRSGTLREVDYLGDQPQRSVVYDFAGLGPAHAVKQQTSTVPGDPVATTAYTYDGLGRELTKNVDGVTARSITQYNEEDLPEQMDAFGQPISLAYDGLGARARKVETATGTTTYYHGELYERRDSGGVRRHVLHLVAGGERFGDLVYDEGAASPAYVASYFARDTRGSVEAVIDGAGAVTKFHYDPFGRRVDEDAVEEPPVDPAAVFAGHPFDVEAGLYAMRARMFDPDKRRFTTSDPIFTGHDVFAYVSNDPINRVDPTGKQEEGGGGIFDQWICIIICVEKEWIGGIVDGTAFPDDGEAVDSSPDDVQYRDEDTTAIGPASPPPVPKIPTHAPTPRRATTTALPTAKRVADPVTAEERTWIPHDQPSPGEFSNDSEDWFLRNGNTVAVVVAVVAVAPLAIKVGGAAAVSAGAEELLDFDLGVEIMVQLQGGARDITSHATAQRGVNNAVGSALRTVGNSNGGQVVLTIRPITIKDFASLVLSSNGPVAIITGTHGNAAGDVSWKKGGWEFFDEDTGAFGHLANVSIYHLFKMTPAQLEAVLNGEGTIVCAWCYSEATELVIDAIMP
jgi:RHS repeat-associated protein